MNTTDKLLEMAQAKKKQSELTDEEAQELKKACRFVFSSREGKIVAKYMLKTCGIYKFPDINLDHAQMCFASGMRYIVKMFVLGMLDKQLLTEINGDENAR